MTFQLKNNVSIVLISFFLCSWQVNAIVEHAVTLKHAQTGLLITLLSDQHLDEENMKHSKEEQEIVLSRAKKPGAALIVEDRRSMYEAFTKTKIPVTPQESPLMIKLKDKEATKALNITAMHGMFSIADEMRIDVANLETLMMADYSMILASIDSGCIFSDFKYFHNFFAAQKRLFENAKSKSNFLAFEYQKVVNSLFSIDEFIDIKVALDHNIHRALKMSEPGKIFKNSDDLTMDLLFIRRYLLIIEAMFNIDKYRDKQNILFFAGRTHVQDLYRILRRNGFVSIFERDQTIFHELMGDEPVFKDNILEIDPVDLNKYFAELDIITEGQSQSQAKEKVAHAANNGSSTSSSSSSSSSNQGQAARPLQQGAAPISAAAAAAQRAASSSSSASTSSSSSLPKK